MLRIDNLNAYYGESVILRDVSLHVKPGEVVCLMGRNGVGKTTLLKSIMGLLKLRKGTIYFQGEDITDTTPDKRAKRGIGYVPQGRDIFSDLTVEENLTLGLEARNTNGGSIPDEVFRLFPVLREISSRKGGDLSGGQQQQLAIARALVADPKLLLLDEPTEGIQPSIIRDIAGTIHSIKKQGEISILLVEQYLDFALEMADYYYIMHKGSIVSEGSTRELSDDAVKEHLVV
ncbi:MAG: urea ABC transporter ATP-binding subunit UrtE [Candidatus Aquicultorales bacterium]